MDTTKLTGVIPVSVLTQIPDVMIKFEINTPLRLAHFLAQCAHESANFTLVEENLNYSAEGLLKIFPKYFTAETAALYAHQPIKIASRVYANRMGNGSETFQDGYLYRGRGYIQITGKENYTAFAKSIASPVVIAVTDATPTWQLKQIDLLAKETTAPTTPVEDIVGHPELVATKYPLESGAWFFKSHGLLPICDIGATDDVVTAVTKRVNGGINGLPDRLAQFKKFYPLLA